MKFHKLPHLTRDVIGQHYRPVLLDVSLSRDLPRGAGGTIFKTERGMRRIGEWEWGTGNGERGIFKMRNL